MRKGGIAEDFIRHIRNLQIVEEEVIVALNDITSKPDAAPAICSNEEVVLLQWYPS